MSNIYQEIWDADQRGSGVPALFPDEPRDKEKGYVVVKEIKKGDDDHILFPEMEIPERKKKTYELCKALFDNYTLDQTKPERETLKEKEETQRLLDAIVDTEPMRVARAYASEQKGRDLSVEDWKEILEEVWFDTFDMGRGKDLSGFEHVIVGEQKGGKVQGYHFWYKYYLDDSVDYLRSDDIVYKGVRYNKKTDSYQNEEGMRTPYVVTLAYRWYAYDHENDARRPLFKPIGGFWVGCSIEGLLAIGTIRHLFGNQAPDEAVLNGARYYLAIHRSPNHKHVRTFFPKFLGLEE